MDALVHLEKVHQVLDHLSFHGCSAGDPSEDRQLAELLILLAESAKSLADLVGRLQLLAKRLAFMSSHPHRCSSTEESHPCLEALSSLLTQGKMMTPGSEQSRHKLEMTPWRAATEGKERALVGLPAMERARTTLEDFVSSYFMFHGLDASKAEDVFRHLPILTFVESYIYQLDEANEEGLLARRQTPGAEGAALPPAAAERQEGRAAARRGGEQLEGEDDAGGAAEALRADCIRRGPGGRDPFGALKEELAARGLLSDRLASELNDGVEFWRLERSLCSALLHGEPVRRDDVMRALRLKSFDYRVLNLLLYKVREEPVNEDHFSFLALSEVLVEISDDLYDYEDDVLKNSFNVLRMFSAIYGHNDAPAEMAKYICETEEQYETSLRQLDPVLAAKYRKRCKEATIQGGGQEASLAPMGRWSIPPLLPVEAAYRLGCVEH